MIVLIHGPDAAMTRSHVASITREHDPDGANTSQLDGRTAPLSQIIAAISSVGFFGSARVVVVHDLMTRASRPAKGTSSDDVADDDPTTPPPMDVSALFAAVPAENLLVLADADLTAIPATIKRIAPANMRILSGEPPRGQHLIAWLEAAARDAGSSFERGAARHLAETTFPQSWESRPSNPRYDRPPDLDALRNEIDKLALAAHPGAISRAQIDELIHSGEDDRVFRFIESAANGPLDVALAELSRLQDAGEEPAKLAAQVYQQHELATLLAAGPRIDPAMAGKAIGLSNPNRMVGIAGSRRGRSAESAFAALANARATDRQSKRGELRQPIDALYHLILSVAPQRGTRRGDVR
jgi:DNA polymerase III delta subunit